MITPTDGLVLVQKFFSSVFFSLRIEVAVVFNFGVSLHVHSCTSNGERVDLKGKLDVYGFNLPRTETFFSLFTCFIPSFFAPHIFCFYNNNLTDEKTKAVCTDGVLVRKSTSLVG